MIDDGISLLQAPSPVEEKVPSHDCLYGVWLQVELLWSAAVFPAHTPGRARFQNPSWEQGTGHHPPSVPGQGRSTPIRNSFRNTSSTGGLTKTPPRGARSDLPSPLQRKQQEANKAKSPGLAAARPSAPARPFSGQPKLWDQFSASVIASQLL